MIQLVFAFDAKVFVVVAVEVACADAEFEVPAAGDFHLVAVGESAAVVVAFIDVFFERRYELYSADVVSGVDGVYPEEVAAEGPVEPVACFGQNLVVPEAHIVGQEGPGVVSAG